MSNQVDQTMTKIRKTWIYQPPKPPRPNVPASVKAEVTQKATLLVETLLKPRHIKPPPKNARFNYIVDLNTKWHRHYFYFCAKYAVPGPNALAPFFESKFARLEYIGRNRFNLSFVRHTGEWIEIALNHSLDECLAAISEGGFFEP